MVCATGRALLNRLRFGERFLGTVVKTTTFGAFVSLLPGKDGLLHITQIRKLHGGARIDNVDDVLKVVSGSGVRLILVPRADADPDAERYRSDRRKELGDHAQAAGKDGPAHGRLGGAEGRISSSHHYSRCPPRER